MSRTPYMTLEDNGLYILLSELDVEYKWHWGLYLSNYPHNGYVYHITNDNPAGKWIYETKTSTRVEYSDNIILALKIAAVHPDLRQALGERIRQISAQNNSYGELTCRTWLLQVLHELDAEGYISLTGSVREVEAEAKDAATLAASRGNRRNVKKSNLSKA
jgi:hypothetical protein